MLGWIDLKAWIAACWKGSWNVDPLALSVPERLESLLPDPLPPDPVVLVLGLDEPQAARTMAVAPTARPAAAIRRTRKRRMSNPPVGDRERQTPARRARQ